MKPKKKARFRFPESGESFQIIEAGPPVYYVPVPEKCTVVKPVPMGDWVVGETRILKPKAKSKES